MKRKPATSLDPQPGDLIPGPDNTIRAAPTALSITPVQWQTVLDHLRSSLPAEGCGLLACAENDDDEVAILEVFLGRNTLESPTRFRMDPAQVIDAFRSMRENGLRLAAIFHSHPGTPPTLSPIDLAEAHYPDAAIVIVSFVTDPPHAKAWRIERGRRGANPVEIPIHVRQP
jgi:proteasome lid subunit RPN8/RPN11